MTVNPYRPLALLAVAGSATVLLVGCSSGSGRAVTGSATPSYRAGSARSVAPTPARSASTRVRTAVAAGQLPQPLSRGVALRTGAGGILLLGGLQNGDHSTDEVLEVRPGGATTIVGHLPQGVHDSAGALTGGVATLFGGGASHEVATIQQFDPATARAAVAGRLPVALSDVGAADTAAGVVVFGGYDGVHTSSAVWLVAGNGQVRQLGTLPVAVRYAASAVISTPAGQRIVVFGGESGGTATSAVQQIDPATGRTAVVGHLPAARTQASALTLGGTVFVCGGAVAGTANAPVLPDVLRYNSATNTFDAAGTLPYPVADAAAVTIDNMTGYLLGGETPARTARIMQLSAQ
jgi:hypothetical protein